MKLKFEIETYQKLGNAVASLLEKEFTEGTPDRPMMKTAWGTRTPEGLGRSVLNLLLEITGGEIPMGKEIYSTYEKCGNSEDFRLFSTPAKRNTHLESLMKEYRLKFPEATWENLDEVSKGHSFIECQTHEVE